MGKTILIVDDSSILRVMVNYILAPAGFNVIEGENGKEGLKALQNIRAQGMDMSLIICDISMPEMDGFSFIKEVKKTPFKSTPILVLTTENRQAEKMKGKDAGANAWLVKPYNPAQLLQIVKKMIV